MVRDDELVPGVKAAALAASERLTLTALRLIAAGRSQCPALSRSFDGHLGVQGRTAFRGILALARLLPLESRRKLSLGWICVKGVTWDEAAILALLEAAQRSDADAIAVWMQRLGLETPSRELKKGLAWAAAAFAVSDKAFDPEIATLTRASPSRRTQMRDQIEAQIGPLGD